MVERFEDCIPQNAVETRSIITRGQFCPPGIVVACVRPSVCHQVCPRDNSSSVQARLAKLGPKMRNTCVKVSDILGGKSTLTFKVKFNLKIKIYSQFQLVRAITHNPFKPRITKFGQGVQNTLVDIPLLFWGAIDLDLKKVKFPGFTTAGNTQPPYNHQGAISTQTAADFFIVSILCTYLSTQTVSRPRLFYSVNTLHVF